LISLTHWVATLFLHAWRVLSRSRNVNSIVKLVFRPKTHRYTGPFNHLRRSLIVAWPWTLSLV
jgi:hypothetical protein